LKKFRAVEVTASVIDCNNGSYAVSYKPPLVGNFPVGGMCTGAHTHTG